MASFNADILLSVKGSEAAQRQIERLEASLDRIGKKADIDISSQIRLKGEQALLKEKIKNFAIDNKQLKVSQDIARLANERAKGLAQYANAIGPQVDRIAQAEKRAAQIQRQAQQQRLETQRQTLQGASKIVFQTKLELALASKLVGVEKAITAEQQKQIQAGQALQKQKDRALKSAELERKRTRTARNSRLQSAALGVGFPLLFGGGLGSASGGLLGSAGGFGGQVLGSALGTKLDDFVKSAGELAAALSATSLDIEKVVKAAGETGPVAQKLIEETKAVAGAEEAAAAAARLLATQIGQDSVDAIKDFGEASKELESAVAILNSEFAALAATLLGPVLRALANIVERANAAQAAADIAREGGAGAARLDAVGDAVRASGGSADDVNLARQAEAVKIIAERRAEALATVRETNLAESKSLDILQNEGKILELGGNILNDQVFSLMEQNAELEYKAKLNKENITDLEREIAKQEYLNKLKGLENRRDAAAERAGRGLVPRGGRSGTSDAERLARSLAAEERKQYDLATKINMLGETKLEQLEIQRQRMDGLFQARTKEIVLGEKDETLRAAKLESLQLEYFLQLSQNSLAMERLAIEEKIADIQGRQGVENLSAQLDQELAAAERRPSGFEFADQQANLQFEQQVRYENALRSVNQQIEVQTALEKSKDEAVSKAATKQLGFLRDQKTIYEEMLPQIFAAEQAQLKFNQALSLVEAPVSAFVNGLTSGLQGIVEGTKSVEEAFADMLKGIADALVQTAAQMIAQYLAIAAARALAGLGGGGPKPVKFADGFGFLDSLDGFAEGGRPNVGAVSLVGERGPELFIPDQPGRIVSNKDSNAAMARYNPGNARSVEELAATGEGGKSMGWAFDPVINVSTGNTLMFEGTNYVTQEDFQAGVSQAAVEGAKAGEARTLRRLRMSPGTRSKLGF